MEDFKSIEVVIRNPRDFDCGIFEDGTYYKIILESVDGFEALTFPDKNFTEYYLVFKNINFQEILNLRYINSIDSIKFENCTGIEFVEFPKIVQDFIFVNCPIKTLNSITKVSNIEIVDYKSLNIVDFSVFENFKDSKGWIRLNIFGTDIDTLDYFKNISSDCSVIFQHINVKCELVKRIGNVRYSIGY